MKRKKIEKAVSCLLLAAAMTVSVFPQFGTPIFAEEKEVEKLDEQTMFERIQWMTLEDIKSYKPENPVNDNDYLPFACGNANSEMKALWRIMGSHDNNLILWSSTNMLSVEDDIDTEHDQRFDEPFENETKPYDEKWGCTYQGEPPAEVAVNHYGGSRIRKVLKKIEKTNFKESEKSHMRPTTIYTEDMKNNTVYSTTDILYLPYGEFGDEYITIGANSPEELNSGISFYTDDTRLWLRAPYQGREHCALYFSNRVAMTVVDSILSGAGEIQAAFEYDISDLLFASSTPLPYRDDDFLGYENYLVPRFRAQEDLGSAQVSYDKTEITVKNVLKDRPVYLMVGYKLDANHVYGVRTSAKRISEDTVVSVDDMIPGTESFLADGKVWLESRPDDRGMLTYAEMADWEQGHDVNIAADEGESLIIVDENGSQKVGLGKAMQDITVEVADGFYLPDGYLDSIQGLLKDSGLTVVLNETKDGFTISGIPTRNVDVILPPAAAFQKADTPAVEVEKVTSTSIEVNVTNHKEEFGKIEYKWGDGNWEENKSTVSGLTPDTPYDLAVRFTGNEIYQMSDEAVLEITTMKEGDVTVPTGLKTTYREGLKLSDVDLSSTGWTWADGDTALTVGTDKYPAYFDISELESTHDFSSVEGYDKDNHRVEREIQVTVEKGTSTVTITTETLDKTYDKTAVNAPKYTTSGSKGEKMITWQEKKGTADAPKWEPINGAPSEVGNYRVVVTLMEDSNYKSAEAMLEFAISKAENVWTEELSIEGWTYGSYDETKNAPSAEAKFGDVVFAYSDKEDGTYTSKMPENAGTWYVKAAVAGTENYTGLEAVQEFVIKKAIPTPDEVTGLIIVQGHPLSELELPEQFRWTDETQIAEELGTHPFKAIYTPEDTVNYEIVETNIDVQVVPALSVINHIPTISASDKTITVGETFDPLKDVTANDKEDGDLTSEIKVIGNTVDTEKAGTYEVIYRVTDSQNASVTKTIKVNVKAKEQPEEPNTPDDPSIPDKDDTPDEGNTSDQNVTDKDNTDTNKSVQTGDRTNVLLWVMLLGASSVGLLCGLYRKKR